MFINISTLFHSSFLLLCEDRQSVFIYSFLFDSPQLDISAGFCIRMILDQLCFSSLDKNEE